MGGSLSLSNTYSSGIKLIQGQSEQEQIHAATELLSNMEHHGIFRSKNRGACIELLTRPNKDPSVSREGSFGLRFLFTNKSKEPSSSSLQLVFTDTLSYGEKKQIAYSKQSMNDQCICRADNTLRQSIAEATRL